MTTVLNSVFGQFLYERAYFPPYKSDCKIACKLHKHNYNEALKASGVPPSLYCFHSKTFHLMSVVYTYIFFSRKRNFIKINSHHRTYFMIFATLKDNYLRSQTSFPLEAPSFKRHIILKACFSGESESIL